MQLENIIHRCAFTDCYAINENEIIVHIRTGKDVRTVSIIYEDPYSAGISGRRPWKGKAATMTLSKELKFHYIWEARIVPEFKRLQYYFEISDDSTTVCLLEDDIYTKEQFALTGQILQFFKFPWMNSSDIFVPPSWVEDVVWYQIMPDRFCRSSGIRKTRSLNKWDSEAEMSYWDFYGGDIKGIIEKLGYLKELGITGIYLTPIFQSNSNHKYNTADYEQVDVDFGGENTLKSLITAAHKMGMRVMLDAVFNHSGTEFFAWQDVQKNKEESAYYHWFYINRFPIDNGDIKTKDGRYYSFAFEADMPKLNTNNVEVTEYLIGLCRHWVQEWNIDGIRFDVGNEIAHSFVKRLNLELKKLNPELFLLGEIWHDSIGWLIGDEYDSVMNYPFTWCLDNFWHNKELNSKHFMYGMNKIYSMYREQTNKVLFNFIDTHDIGRAYSRCGNLDIFFQWITVLMTMQGSPCLYYGTEIAMDGVHNPYNRQCMPWDRIESGQYHNIINEVQVLIFLRNQYPQFKSGDISWVHNDISPRLLHYIKTDNNSSTYIHIYLNAQSTPQEIECGGNIVYSRNFKGNVLNPNGILMYGLEGEKDYGKMQS